MEAYCHAVLKDLTRPIPSDPIERCPLEVRSRLTTDPENAIEAADKQLRVFPFSTVDVCWRRLYTDASIAKVTLRILKHVSDGTMPPGSEWLDEMVKTLDMALIMTGALLRESMVEGLLRRLGELLSHYEVTDCCDRVKSTFATTDSRRPEIRHPIGRSGMSLSTFEDHLKHPVPHVLTGALETWPALHERPWASPSYLLSHTMGGRRLVPVELGRSYTDDDWGQRIMTFREYMNNYLLPDQPAQVGYLAQHDLFHQIPALRNDICIPDFCYTSPPLAAPGTPLHGRKTETLEEPLLNAWLGPAGTISPLHTDPYHNILCQVVGKKYVRLYSPEQSARLYPRGVEGEGVDMSNTSRVPPEEVEMGGMELSEEPEFPLFAEAEYVETVLEEGECLYIPVGWWHYVRSLTTSFSVSFWWN